MSGTLLEGRAELRRVYGVPVVRVPLRKASRRVVRPTRVFGTHEARWQFVVLRAQEIHARGGAVLIGTDSCPIPRRSPSAWTLRPGACRAQRAAGPARSARHRHSRATGTHHRSHEHGGPRHRHRAVGGRRTKRRAPCRAVPGERLARIDRQFTGRAARRGEPGSCETLLSLESPPMLTFLPAWITAGRGAPSKSGRAGWESRSRAYHCGSRTQTLPASPAAANAGAHTE